MAETKAIPFEEKVFEKNKTTNEKVVPKSTGLKGKNSELQAGENSYASLYKQVDWGNAS